MNLFMNSSTSTTLSEDGDGWHKNLIEDAPAVGEFLTQTKRVAVLGIKTEAQSSQPAFYVPQYLASAGLEVILVPVYYPEITHILGRRVYRQLVEVPGDRSRQRLPPLGRH